MWIPQRIAAVPAYIPVTNAQTIEQAAPGHRFQGYFRNWQGDGGEPFSQFKGKARVINNPPPGPDRRKANAQLKAENDAVLNEVCKLPSSSITQIAAIRTRQQTLLAHYGSSGYHISATSTAPFATGLGNEHPIENGFAFLTPYGLPYLAGSGVKGILRRAMQELCGDGEDGFTPEAINALFGPENIDKPEDARRGALDFWDVFPNPAGGKLVVEIMTPHFGGYYQNGDTPHDSGAPIPVSFLAVPARSQFDFSVVCHSSRLPEALQDQWRILLDRAFRHAFEWVGFGAKTSVGYGAMEKDLAAQKRHEEAHQAAQDAARKDQEKRAREEANSRLSPAMRAAQEFFVARVDINQSELSTLFGGLKKGVWSSDTKFEIAQYVRQLMIKDKKWKEKSEKKNPAKDNDHQDTLMVMKCLGSGK